MKSRHLIIILLPVFLTSCYAIKKIPEQKEFTMKSDKTKQSSEYTNFTIESSFEGATLRSKMLADNMITYQIKTSTVRGQGYQVKNPVGSWVQAYTDFYDAKKIVQERAYVYDDDQPSSIGFLADKKKLYIFNVPYFNGRIQVVEAFVPIEAINDHCGSRDRKNNNIGCLEYNKAKARSDRYMQVYISQHYQKKLISSNDYSLLKNLNASSENKISLQNETEKKISVTVPLTECSFSSSELNYSEKFYSNSSNEVIINLEQIANKYSKLDLTKKYIFNLVLTTNANGKKDEISKEIAIDLSKYLKSDINFVSYQISKEENNLVFSPGINNKYFDAGERVDFYLTLANSSENYYISSSAFLSVSDPYLKIIGDNIRFDEIYPNKNKKSLKPITLFIDPNTPNNHETEIMVKIKDSGFDKVNFTAFPITIYNVGPVDFEKAIVDDDNLGGSQGDGDGVLEAGEIIELIIFIRNNGVVDLQNVKAKLTPSNSSRLHVNILDDEQEYENIKSKTDRSIPADFDIKLNNSIGNSPVKLTFNLSISGNTSFGAQYSWESDFELFVNAKDPKLSRLIKK